MPTYCFHSTPGGTSRIERPVDRFCGPGNNQQNTTTLKRQAWKYSKAESENSLVRWPLAQPPWITFTLEIVIKSAVSAAFVEGFGSRGAKVSSRDQAGLGSMAGLACRRQGRGGCASSQYDHSFQIPSCAHNRPPFSGPCRIEQYIPASTRVFDAG